MPQEEDVLKFEEKFDYESLINEALNNVEVKFISDEDNKIEDIL